MESSNGIITFRDMRQWQWFKDMPVCYLFEYILRIACVENTHCRGIDVPSGSVLTSLADLSHETGMSIMQVRKALEKLLSSHDITIHKCGNSGSLITVVNWEAFDFVKTSKSTVTHLVTHPVTQQTEAQVTVIQNDTECIQQDVTHLVTHPVTEGVLSNKDITHPVTHLVTQQEYPEDTELQEDTNEPQESVTHLVTHPVTHLEPPRESQEERSPTPSKEDKENTNSKEKNINININKKEKFFDDSGEKTVVKQKRKPIYTISFNFEKSIFEGITEQDMALWRQAYPAIDVENEILKAACWLAANPKNAKSNYKSFLNKWFNKAQDHAPRISSQPMLPFSQPMSYGDRKRQQAGQDVSQIPGFIGKEVDFDKDAPDNPF